LEEEEDEEEKGERIRPKRSEQQSNSPSEKASRQKSAKHIEHN
jgi:hypothetical protein